MQRFLLRGNALRAAEECQAVKNKEYIYQLNNSRLVLSKNPKVENLLGDVSKYISKANVKELRITHTAIYVILADETSNEFLYQTYGLSDFPDHTNSAYSDQTVLEYLLLTLSIYEMAPYLSLDVIGYGYGIEENLVHINAVPNAMRKWEELFSFEIYNKNYETSRSQTVFSYGVIFENGYYCVTRNRSFKAIRHVVLTMPEPEIVTEPRSSWL